MSKLERIKFDATAMEEIEAELDKLDAKQAGAKSAAPPPPGKPAGAKSAAPATPAGRGLLDLKWIRANVSILDVADRLGLARRGRSCSCPFHDDGTPSFSFYKNRAKCHAMTCGWRGGVIDLITAVKSCSVAAALDWIVQEGYAVPALDPEHGRRWRRSRAGVGGLAFDAAVQSGLLGELPKPAGLILCTLAGSCDPDTQRVEISYSGLARRSGVKNRSTLSGALQLLRRLDLLTWELGKLPGGWRAPSIYHLTIEVTHCALARQKLSMIRLDGHPVETVERDQSLTVETAFFTRGRPASEPSIPRQSAEPSSRKGNAGRKAPNTRKSARPPVEKPPPEGGRETPPAAAPPAGKRRERRIRHRGFADWRGFP